MRKKITVITGGSAGLGLASARFLAPETSLLLCARSQNGLDKAKSELSDFGADVYTFKMDASNSEDAKSCAEYAASLGDVVNVIHTAGVSPANTATDDILRINGLGPVNMVQAFYPVLTDGGVLILFSSTAAYNFDTNPQMVPLIPVAKQIFSDWEAPDFDKKLKTFLVDIMKLPEPYQAGSAYCLTKYFVKHFACANVRRFAKKGCRILSVSPGSYLTRMHQALIDNQPETAAGVMAGIPLERWGHAYEMGALIHFLCSPGAAYITGVDILADGGCTYNAAIEQIS